MRRIRFESESRISMIKWFYTHLEYTELARELSAAQGTHSYSHCLPALSRKLRFLKWTHSTEHFKTTLDYLRGSPDFPNQSLSQIKKRQTEITTLYICNKYSSKSHICKPKNT